MTFDDAIEWVSSNRKGIIGYGRKYLKYSPYDVEDLVSCANQAAIMAVFVVKESVGVMFKRAFWDQYRQLLREIIPYPANHRWSPSVPSDKYENFVELDTDTKMSLNVFEMDEEIASESHSFDEREDEDLAAPSYLSESVFWASYEHLSPIERRFLYKVLGLDNRACGSFTEASVKLGKTLESTTAMFERVSAKLKRLFNLGVISIGDLPSEALIRKFKASLDQQAA